MRFPFKHQFAALTAAVLLGCGLCACKDSTSSHTDVAPTLPATQTILIPSALPEYFSIDIPDAFTATSSAYYDEYYVQNDASIILSSETLTIGGQSLQDYVKDVKNAYANTADAFKLLSEETETINGKKAYLLEFSYAIIGDDVRQNMHCLTAVLLEQDTAYLVTCKSLAETFPSYKNAFRSAIQSIVITPPPAASQTTPPATTTTNTTTTTQSTTSDHA